MTRRIHCRIPERLDDWLDELVESGYFMNRSEATREGVRRLAHEPQELEDVRDPLGHVNDERLTVRYPDGLIEEIEGFVRRGAASNYGAVIRRAIVVVVDEYLPQARATGLEQRRYVA